MKWWWAGRLIHSRDAGSHLAGLRRGTPWCLSGLQPRRLCETGTERGVSRERGSMPARKRSAGRVREPALPSRRDSALFHVYAPALTQFAAGAPVGPQGGLSDHPEGTNERSGHRRPPPADRRSSISRRGRSTGGAAAGDPRTSPSATAPTLTPSSLRSSSRRRRRRKRLSASAIAPETPLAATVPTRGSTKRLALGRALKAVPESCVSRATSSD